MFVRGAAVFRVLLNNGSLVRGISISPESSNTFKFDSQLTKLYYARVQALNGYFAHVCHHRDGTNLPNSVGV